MWTDAYNSLYRYILISCKIKEGKLRSENKKFTIAENWKITKANIIFGYKGEQIKDYIQEDYIIHNGYMNKLIRNNTCKANIMKAIQLNNKLFMEAIKPYQERELSEKDSINDLERAKRRALDVL